MFSIFKSKESNTLVDEHVGDFNNFFTEDQKKAILVSLFVIANSDEEFHEREVDFFKETATALQYDVDDETIVEEFVNMDHKRAMKALKKFSDSQKEWYLITVLGMVHADGKAVEEELAKVIKVLKGAGMSRAQISSVKQRFDLFRDVY